MIDHRHLACAVLKQARLDARGAPQLAVRRGATMWLTVQTNADRAFWANAAGVDDDVVRDAARRVLGTRERWNVSLDRP